MVFSGCWFFLGSTDAGQAMAPLTMHRAPACLPDCTPLPPMRCYRCAPRCAINNYWFARILVCLRSAAAAPAAAQVNNMVLDKVLNACAAAAAGSTPTGSLFCLLWLIFFLPPRFAVHHYFCCWFPCCRRMPVCALVVCWFVPGSFIGSAPGSFCLFTLVPGFYALVLLRFVVLLPCCAQFCYALRSAPAGFCRAAAPALFCRINMRLLRAD